MIDTEVPSRRAVLRLAVTALTLCSGRAVAQICGKPASGELATRRSLNFKDVAPDPKRSCGGCAFFTAAQAAECGRCMMLSGGTVAATGVCDSWTKK